ncbi:MAG: myo-inositol-1(or 4)-monophosphatase [Halobacteriales archaeon]|jgi:myo-inositol-1(or 4)-monophosphatase
MNGDDRRDVAVRAAEAGATVALESFRAGIAVDTKEGKTDVVTQADRDAQAAVVSSIEDEFRADEIVGEESEARKTVPAEGPAWVIDPIDGTNNYVRGVREWGTSVAAVVDGEPVAAATVLPALGDTYVGGSNKVTRNGQNIAVSNRTDPELCAVAPTIWWGFDRRDEYQTIATGIIKRFADLRRVGCAQASLAMLADGAIDGVVTNLKPNPWDSIAGVFLVRRAGGKVTDLSGESWHMDSTGLVASNGQIHDELLDVAQTTDAVRTH